MFSHVPLYPDYLVCGLTLDLSAYFTIEVSDNSVLHDRCSRNQLEVLIFHSVGVVPKLPVHIAHGSILLSSDNVQYAHKTHQW